MAVVGAAVDEKGNYCGKSVETGEFVDMGPEKVGYCGPDCKHCIPNPYYAIQHGVWVCAADYDYLEV